MTRTTSAVTGAFGFSGRYIAARLLRSGQRVVTLTNSPKRANPFAGEVEARPLNFASPDSLASSLDGVETLYNTYWVRFNRKNPALNQPDQEEALRNSEVLFRAAKLAGVRRIAHISVAHADAASPLPYYRNKGLAEQALAASGVNHAIFRPAMLFGPGSVLLNNLAWTLRRFPLCFMFGDGAYRLRPIFVDDLAALMCGDCAAGAPAASVAAAASAVSGSQIVSVTPVPASGSGLIHALGPEEYSFRDLMRMLGEVIGCRRPLIGMPVTLAWPGVWLLGKVLGESLVTRDEISGLMNGLLTVTGAPASGGTKLSEWARANAASLGRVFISENSRRRDRVSAY
ncbi:MAG: NAD(P)H-binding protein [Deltaproteobacteria bacterium]|jgi:NADH dehydrogenase|nr:NAD(P)H-binding protein [Deltaproteobacteria bacterium]